MADEIPTFVGQQEIEPGPEIDAAPIHQAYTNLFNDIQKRTGALAQQAADERATEKGSIAGEDPNFKPMPAIGEAAKAYNKAGLVSN